MPAESKPNRARKRSTRRGFLADAAALVLSGPAAVAAATRSARRLGSARPLYPDGWVPCPACGGTGKALAADASREFPGLYGPAYEVTCPSCDRNGSGAVAP